MPAPRRPTWLNSAANPANHFFNSSIPDRRGTNFLQRTPAHRNQLGFDADTVNATGRLQNNQTSTVPRLATDCDGFAPNGVSFATDLCAPSLNVVKTVSPVGQVHLGDVLTYTVSVASTGLDAATNTILTDSIPTGTTYVPGGLQVVSGANAGAEPAGEEEGDAAVPACPPRRPPACDPAGRAEPPPRPGDVAARLPRRRASGAAQRRRRVPRARRRVGPRVRLHPLAPSWALRARTRPRRRQPAVRRPGRAVRLGLHAVPRVDEPRRRGGAGRGLMDYTGDECIPRRVSLLEAHVNQPARVALLQHHDGYGPELPVRAELPASYRRPDGEIETLLGAVPIFALLEPGELATLARTARPLTLGPTERLVVPGQDGESLFVIADGELEVLVRRYDGEDVVVDTVGKGAVVGEMSLLTGAPRTAAVRALDGAVAYEIGARQYGPLLDEALLDALAELMETRLDGRHDRLAGRGTLAARIRATLCA